MEGADTVTLSQEQTAITDTPQQSVQPLAPVQSSFQWTQARRKAASLLAADELTDEEIAAKCGVTRTGLYKWKIQAPFARRVEAIRERLGAMAAQYAIGRKARRLSKLNERWNRLHQVIAERAADPDMANVPGGTSGLLCQTEKQIGNGPSAERVTEYAVDTGLLKECRELEKQAAVETGQWVEQKHTHSTGAVLVLNVIEEVIAPRQLPCREVPLVVSAAPPAAESAPDGNRSEADTTLPGPESLPGL